MTADYVAITVHDDSCLRNAIFNQVPGMRAHTYASKPSCTRPPLYVIRLKKARGRTRCGLVGTTMVLELMTLFH